MEENKKSMERIADEIESEFYKSKESIIPFKGMNEAIINSLAREIADLMEPATKENKAKLLMKVIELTDTKDKVYELIHKYHSQGWAFTSNETDMVKIINKFITNSKQEEQTTGKKCFDENQISDGYHTFAELYDFRKVYNAVLFNNWYFIANTFGYIKYVIMQVHKSWKHSDGELCFGGGWFIVSAMLPTGLISNHYKAEDWDLFKVPEVEKALFKFDGHTGADVLTRLKAL